MSYNTSNNSNSNYPQMSQSDWDKEIWKPCPDFENKYLISNKGNIKSIGTYNTCKTGRLLKLCKKKGRNGYLQVRLHDNNRAKTFEVHTLVAKAFIPNPNNFKCINHINEDKTDNNVENLEWCTNKYNVSYSKPNILQIALDETILNRYNSQIEASKALKIPKSTINRWIKTGKCINKNYKLIKE